MLSISYLAAKIRNNFCNSVAKIHYNVCIITNKYFYYLGSAHLA
ncbi:hypothetical protein HMPREF3218_0200606 [Prevotella bivia]|nr:hypothetical protein HMPREF3218_0200606 [Prevotella bivia]